MDLENIYSEEKIIEDKDVKTKAEFLCLQEDKVGL
jgi:hypothetical protein